MFCLPNIRRGLCVAEFGGPTLFQNVFLVGYPRFFESQARCARACPAKGKTTMGQQLVVCEFSLFSHL
ncbi:hypothetical protein Taro_024582 [Colocasia esculenta]|uniref:Uncharacterized protein n=1 Tax=Colocasia esculenta TaxID=4460 RepID=A0A843VKT5_COLES|nr:hypothetical protein [Colocasia esculenta]